MKQSIALGAPTYTARADDMGPAGPTQSNDAINTLLAEPSVVSAVPLPPLKIIALTRLAFGISFYNYENYPTAGSEDQNFTDWVNAQLNPNFADDAECNNRIAQAGLTTLNKSLQALWHDHLRNPDDNPNFHREDPAKDTCIVTFIRAVYSKWQLFEVLVDFWHNHFNVYAWDYYYASATWVHYDRDVIRQNALGNFRTMLEAVAKSPAMLFYLDNYLNTVAGPNENYAREMFELHTMGAENYAGVIPRETVPGYPNPTQYCDGDVYEATRCFTGWRVNDDEDLGDTGVFAYDASRHDRFQKIILGASFPETWANEPEKDGKTVLDKVAQHPGAGRFIVRKLWRRLIGDNTPPPGQADAFLDAVAKTFTDNWQSSNQIKLVLEQLLLGVPASGSNPAIPSPFKTTWAQKIKRPFEAAVSMLRAIGADFRPDRENEDFFWYYDAMGQGLWSRRPPDGYPDRKEAWNSTVSMLMRWRLCNWIMEEGSPLDRTDIKVNLAGNTPANIRTPNAVADTWIGWILGRAMDSSTPGRAEVVSMLAQGANPATYQLSIEQLKERLPHAVALILMSPDFQYR
jgi:uncharacterized protein (DUF1800 family)